MPRRDTPAPMPRTPKVDPGYYSLCVCCNGFGLLAGDGEVRPCHNCHTTGLIPHDGACDRSLVEWGS
jgi:hypothetical protein